MNNSSIRMDKYLLFAIVVFSVFLASCKKENGRFFLRVIPPSDTAITDLKVLDASGEITADGQYYEVKEYLELAYDLKNVISTRIKDWDETMIYDEYYYRDITFHEYLGEFERDEKDKYYTLKVNYRQFIDEDVRYNQWGEYYYYYYNYQDSSKLSYSYEKE